MTVFDPIRKDTLLRLIPHAGTLLNAIIGEAQVKDIDQAYTLRKRFDLREEARNMLTNILTDNPKAEQIRRIKDWCKELLDNNRKYAWIPSTGLNISHELCRIFHEGPDKFSNRSVGEIHHFLENLSDGDDLSQLDNLPQVAFRILVFIALDLIMNIEGKHDNRTLVPIVPSKNPNSSNRDDLIEIPSSKFFGFGGFTSKKPREYEVKLARFCTKSTLESLRRNRDQEDSVLIKRANLPAPPNPLDRLTVEDSKVYQADFKAKIGDLAGRVGEIIRQSHFFSGGIGLAFGMYIESKIKEIAEQGGKERYEVWVAVRNKSFELDATGVASDIKPIRANNKFILFTFIDYDVITQTWSGPHVRSQKLLIDQDFSITEMRLDSVFCEITLPDKNFRNLYKKQPNPHFGITIEDNDKGKTLPVSRWSIRPNVVSFDKTVF